MNPSEKSCWNICSACSRCADKGKYAKCASCSGRHDPLRRWDPYDIDDRCRCTEGVLQFRMQNGRLILTRYPDDPFAGRIKHEQMTADERDWYSYLGEQRELRDDEDWDPVQFLDGSSTTNWHQNMKRGVG